MLWALAKRLGTLGATPTRSVVAILTTLSCGCGGAPPTSPVRPPEPPPVVESYELDERNRPLTEEERRERLAALDADPEAFVDELLAAPPVRQAEALFVLQQRPEIARKHRDAIESLAKSDHGIVRRAASFALDAIEKKPVEAPAP